MTLDHLVAAKVTLIATPIFLLCILIETVLVRYFGAKGSLHTKDDGVSIILGITSIFANGATAFITVGALFWVQQYQLFQIPLTALSLVACFVLDDLRFYVHHRIAHRCRWVWAMHMVHHSSQRYCFAVALRQAWTKHFTGTMFLTLPLVLLGFSPITVLFCGALNGTLQFFLHTESVGKLHPWIEAVFNTPSHHRVHHGSNPEYLDANYAGTLIIWDRMFGTFVAEDDAIPVRFGLVKNLETFNPIKIAFIEYWQVALDVFGKNRSLKDRLLYLFAPPGWSHDGSRLSSAEIKRAHQQALNLAPSE